MATVRTNEGAEQKSEAIDSHASSPTEQLWCCWGETFGKMVAQLCERKRICTFGHGVINVSFCMALSCKEIREAKKVLKDRENIVLRAGSARVELMV